MIALSTLKPSPLNLKGERPVQPIGWDEAGEEYLRGWAEEGWGQSCAPRPSRPIDHYSWAFAADFPLAQLVGSPAHNGRDAWVDWLVREAGRSDRPPNYYPDMEAWWAVEALRGVHCCDPVIAAVEEDGRAYVWEGYHRTALSHKLGLLAVPVVLGRLRPDAPGHWDPEGDG